MLLVKILEPNAKLPTVAHPGEDLGYDLYSLEDVTIQPFQVNKVRTGIAVAFDAKYGLIIKDRSSMALSGIFTVGGVIDAGYRGEIVVLLRSMGTSLIDIAAGQKIAQMIPTISLTGTLIEEVESLPETTRGVKGFGSTGVC